MLFGIDQVGTTRSGVGITDSAFRSLGMSWPGPRPIWRRGSVRRQIGTSCFGRRPNGR